MKRPTGSGIITNYNCTAECAHCMFASSPECKKEYISPKMSESLASLLKKASARSVHIGGGEPFMNFDALINLVDALNRHDIPVDYIETNAFWCRDLEFAERRLDILRDHGVSSVMVSVDPFHIEYVPLELPLKLCALLEKKGFSYFVWQDRFLRRLMKLDITKTHTQEELRALLGEDYIADTTREYGLGMNGRALSIAYHIYDKKHYSEFLTEELCQSLSLPRHCHLDLYGNAVPSRCTGLSVDARSYLEGDIDEAKYPVFARLARSGTKELFSYAKENGFVPREDGYPTKCAFCYDMRKYLFETCPTEDLSPQDFYTNMKKYI